jgi:hypothetical protein
MKKRSLVLRCLIVLPLLGSLVACTTTNSLHASIQKSDITMISLNSSLPDEVKVFSGKWGGRYWRISTFGCGVETRYGVDGVLIVKEIVDKQRVDVIYCWKRQGKVSRIWSESPSVLVDRSPKEDMGCRQWNGNPRWATFRRDKDGQLTLSFSVFFFRKGSIDSEIRWEFRFEDGKLEGTWSDSAWTWGEIVSTPGVVSL